ncbi:hypothetical protein S40288_08374 [Stachybotrys chartarum IBT 40288]|nr:hypothetical protein S40288_08374 [Stachybotrys chartarum IBT 40288]
MDDSGKRGNAVPGRGGMTRPSPAEVEELSQQFRPIIREYIQKNFRDHPSPAAMRLRSQKLDKALGMGEHMALDLSILARRPLAESEVVALTQFQLEHANGLALHAYFIAAAAAFSAFRGRRTGRFPLWQPNWKGVPLNPSTLSLPQRIGLWGARFAAYTVAYTFALTPFHALSDASKLSSLLKDPRMSKLREELNAKNPQNRGVQNSVQSRSSDDGYADASSAGYHSSPNTTSSYSGPPQTSTQEYSQPSAAQWPARAQDHDSDLPDALSSDIDDASPVAGGTQYGGRNSNYTSWDQIRRQARGQPSGQRQPPAQDQSWGSSNTSSQWGSEAGNRSEYHDPRESFSYSEPDQEKATVKEQAQKDFDELLERERRDTTQEKSTWSRK